MHLSSPKLAFLRTTNLEVTREADGDPVHWIYFSKNSPFTTLTVTYIHHGVAHKAVHIRGFFVVMEIFPNAIKPLGSETLHQICEIMETDTRYAVRPCLQEGRVTLVLGLHLQEGHHSTSTFLLFLRDVFTRQVGLS